MAHSCPECGSNCDCLLFDDTRAFRCLCCQPEYEPSDDDDEDWDDEFEDDPLDDDDFEDETGAAKLRHDV